MQRYKGPNNHLMGPAIRTVIKKENTLKKLLILVGLLITICSNVSIAGKAKVAVVGPAFFLPPLLPLVVISKSISVIPEFDHEVFVVSDIYWTFTNGYWYKSKGPKAKWIKVKRRHVPPGLVKLPRGKYLKFKPGKPPKHKSKLHKGKKGKGYKGSKAIKKK